MSQYVLARFALMVPVLVGISLLTFVMMRIVPGDVLDVMYADSPMNAQEIADLRHRLGMDKPLLIQYGEWMGGILRFDAGTSLYTRQPVLKEIADRLPVTIQLAAMAFAVQLLIAIPVGVLSATHQDKVSDQFARFMTILGTAIPDFWLATIVLLFLASYVGWIPPLGGVASLFQDPLVNLQQFFLPALVLGVSGAASLARLTRNTLLEVIREDYVRTAFSKGLADRSVWYGHAIKNAMIPVVTNAGSHLGFLLGGTVIIESIFSLPGVGLLTLNAIQHRDVTQLEINVLFLAIVFTFVNLAVDLSYGWLDPRIRYR